MSGDSEFFYLSKANVEALDCQTTDIIAGVQEAFKEKGRGNAEMPPKPGIHTVRDAFIHDMVAHISSTPRRQPSQQLPESSL